MTRLTARHDVMWAMVSDMPAVSAGDDEIAGFDIADGRACSVAPNWAPVWWRPTGTPNSGSGKVSDFHFTPSCIRISRVVPESERDWPP